MLSSQKLKFQVVFSSLVVIDALLITWLILGDSSPFADYLIRHTDLQNAWQTTVLVPFLFSAVISGNPHSPPMLIFIFALIVQWTVFGFLLSIPMVKLWSRLRK